MLMIKNSMSGRKTTGEQSGLQRKIAEKRAKREAEEKEKEEEEKLAKLRDVPLEIIEKQNSETSEAIITAFTDHEGFKKLAKLTTAEIKKRDDDDNEKLEAGIKLAIDKGVLDKDKEDPKPIAINVLGRSPDEVTVEIIEKLGDAPQKGCIMTLEGLSGTGKGTTVAKLKEKLPNSSTWSNGDIFRSITLLAVKFAEEKKVDLEESLKPENLADFMKMLKFDKFGDQFDVEINGLGVKEMVSKVNKTLLKSKEVATNIPQVAAVTQGEVIMFVKDALAQMAASGMNVLVEGRAATLKYIDTPHRFELVMSDENIIGARRAAQRIGSAALAEAKELKDGKTWEILEKICKSMLPAEEADAPGAEQKDEGGKEDEKAKVEEAGKSGGGDNAGKEEEGEKVEVKKEEATPAKEEAKKEDSAKDKDAEKADPGKEEQGAKEEAKKEGAKEEAKKAEA
uniref:(d)CMP kinase n=1 Tax=Norrisiella sphaerica TaxID=552664 RepID=A0A7S2QUC5_9EUKA|mmetsp:Transcript_876/g.1302  ORF Transcript_876/g.1302 Transcript_876/m.1302 type:complete len:453 (+) Transcript_876:2-1360(+)